MLNKPKFKLRYYVETVEPDQVFFLSERDGFWLSDRIYQQLANLIDGERTLEEILEAIQLQRLQENDSVQEQVAFFQDVLNATVKAQYALLGMEQQGYIVENQNPLPDNLAIFCDYLNIDPKEAYRRLQATKVAVKTLGSNLPTSEFISMLESLHIQVAEEGDIEVVLSDDYLNEKLEAFNQDALQRSRPWMLVKPVGTIVWIGPIFHPEKTACWQCLAQRLQNNRPIAGFIQRHKEISTPFPLPLASLASTGQTALGMAATEVFKWIVQGENKRLEGVLVTHDTIALDTQNHTLVKRPQCQDCGQNLINPFQEKPLPIILGSRKKTFTADGGHRSCSPEETLRNYQHHISPITGVVRAIEKVSIGLNGLTHTYLAKHHFATMFDDLNALNQNIRGRSAGKGKTDSQARASALCEAIERYSGVFQGDEIRQKASYQQLGDKAIHPNACMNFSPAQYQNRHEWNTQGYFPTSPSDSDPPQPPLTRGENAIKVPQTFKSVASSGFPFFKGDGRGISLGDLGGSEGLKTQPNRSGWFQKIPEPFDEEREIDWTPVWSLTHQEFKYLPTAYCYYGYPKPEKPDCWADSNGCAAGNTLEEAILQGFMELVERDSVALWWYNRVKRPMVDLESFDEPYFQTLKHFYQTLHRELWVLDITSDLNIPTFAAITRRKDSAVEDIVLGFGSHFDPKLALQRALTEVNQLLPAVLSAQTDGSTHYLSYDPLAIEWWKTATLGNQPYLVADESITPKQCADYSQIWSDDLLDDVMICKQIVEKQGMELLVLDQTRPDIGLKVVKVIVPGMRHFWQRLGSGRLYEVPVQLGWLKQPLQENQLNPFPMWM